MKVLFLQLAIAALCVAQSQARGYNRWNPYRGSEPDYNTRPAVVDGRGSGRRAKEIMGKRVLASVIGILDQLKDIVHDSSLVSTQVCRLEMTMNITGDQTLMGTPIFNCQYVPEEDEGENHNIDPNQIQDPVQDPVEVQDPVLLQDPVQVQDQGLDQDLDQDPDQDLDQDQVPDLDQDQVPDLDQDQVPDLDQDQVPDLDPDQELYENPDEGLVADDLGAESSPDELEKANDESLWSWRNKYARPYRGGK